MAAAGAQAAPSTAAPGTGTGTGTQTDQARELPRSRYDLGTYWGRVRHAADISDPRTLLVSRFELERCKALLAAYRNGLGAAEMTPELWRAKKIVDATVHPETGKPVLLPFRMSSFVLSNLVVTAGMLTPGMGPLGTATWQVANQSLNVAINSANANKSTPVSDSALARSFLLAVAASVSVALGLNALVPRLRRLSPATRAVMGRLVPFAAVASAGAVNVVLMRAEEMRGGIDVFASGARPAAAGDGNGHHSVKVDQKVQSLQRLEGSEQENDEASNASNISNPSNPSLGKSKTAARLAVGQTALSRVLNATPVMAVPPLILLRLQRTRWLQSRPRLVLPVQLGLILTTSLFALPFALAVFPQRQVVRATSLERQFWDKGGVDGMVEFNRGI